VRRAAILVVVALASAAHAHGRDPFLTSIHTRPGAPQDVIAGTTFGLLVSHDGGASWRWLCESALHYMDPYDPDYAYAPSGAMFVQTPMNSVQVSHDGCTFDATGLAGKFASAIAIGGDGALYATVVTGTEAAVYRSNDDGATFPQVATPAQPDDVWESLEVAPNDPARVYLTGQRFAAGIRTPLLFASDNGGASFTARPIADFATTNDSMLTIVGVGTNADHVYARLTYDVAGDDAIYKSTDGGATWSRIFVSTDLYGLAFLVRASGELVAATRTSGAWHSTDGGATWQQLAGAPHISVLVERPGGEVWAGTQNFSYPNRPPIPSVPADGFAIMKSTDLATWTPVLRLEDIAGPASCAPGTIQHDECVASNAGLGSPWCCTAAQLRITSTEIDCTGENRCFLYAVDGLAGDVTVPPSDPGCCQGSPRATTPLVLALAWLLGAARQRGQRRRREHAAVRRAR
jgi:photosystem II stability/assembly factor-like uncharacterized protein